MMLSYKRTVAARRFIQEQGVQQFCNVYKTWKDVNYSGLLWGDELEYFLISTEDEKKIVSLSRIAESVLNQVENVSYENGELQFSTTPEGCTFMLETAPGKPFSGQLEDLGQVEQNMKKRRQLLQSLLPDGVSLLTLPAFPRFCCQLQDPESVEKTLIFPSIRYRSLLNNVMGRAGDAFQINLPVLRDKETVGNPDYLSTHQCLPGHVFGNSYAFGLASTSLQVTIQAQDLQDAQYLHDQLLVISPVLIALTAGAPIFRGYLIDTDSRIAICAQGMDDRTAQERLPQIIEEEDNGQQSPRYGCSNWYLSDTAKPFNDKKHPFNEEVYKTLIDEDVEVSMAMHAAILFTRDTILLTEDHLKKPSEDSTQHFDVLNGSTWPVIRLKIPQSDGSMGWRLEIRPMGSQPTDFENAAFAVFVFLLSRALREFSCNFLIPMSKVHENYNNALSRDAVRERKFYFRSFDKDVADTEDLKLMTVDEIVNGNRNFCGLVSLIRLYLHRKRLSVEVRQMVDRYLRLISKTASGKRPTTARRIREFVSFHPDYKQDSVVTDSIQYDLIKWLKG